MTGTVVISGAAALSEDGSAAALLAVPELVDVAIADRGNGAELVVRNVSSGPLRIAVEDVGDIAIPAAGTTVVPLPAEPGDARLHLQALATTQAQVVMVIVAIEPSETGPIAVGQAIGARTC